ncbi:MAG TPA: response regulator transcription factor [Solirubrobacteraceae bacterium]|nr:response regulator transcription factor [Solirubrobacteraceae bacterium]
MASHLQVASQPQGEDEPSPAAVVLERVATHPIRVVLADDQMLVRRSLRMLLDAESDVEVVAEAADHMTTVRHLHGHEPDVLVLDLRMSDGSGVETVRSLCARVPQTRIVVLTMADDPAFAQRALAAGACGFVVKELADTELVRAVRAAAAGEEYVSPAVAVRLDALHRALTDNKLSQREVEVLRLIALGHTSVEIAQRLHLSPRTIETHRAHIHKKLGLKTRAELVRYALRRGLIG